MDDDRAASLVSGSAEALERFERQTAWPMLVLADPEVDEPGRPQMQRRSGSPSGQSGGVNPSNLQVSADLQASKPPRNPSRLAF